MNNKFSKLAKLALAISCICLFSTLGAQTVDIRVNKKDVNDNTPNVGQTITYTIEIENRGPDDATGLEMLDLLPAGLTFVSATPEQGTYNSGTGIWNVGSFLDGDKLELIIQATVATGFSGQTIVNTVSLNAIDQTELDAVNNTFSRSVTVNAPDIRVNSKNVNDNTPDVGQTITYTIEIENAGTANATGVQMLDLLPAGLTFVSATPTQGTYVSSTGIWNVGAVATGAKPKLTIQATVAAGFSGQTIVNTVSLNALDQNDANSANNSFSRPVTVNAPDIRVIKTVTGGPYNEDQNLTYTLTIRNIGNGPATGVEISDLLPGALVFVSSAASQGSYDTATGIWNLGALATGQEEDLDIVVKPIIGSSGTDITNTAVLNDVDQAESPSNLANNISSVAIFVATADLIITKSVNDNSPDEGQTIEYSIEVENNGNGDASGVVISDILPVGVTFSSFTAIPAGSSASSSNDSITWTILDLDDGQTRTLDFEVTVDAGTAARTISNIAFVKDFDQVDTIKTNNRDTLDIFVNGADVSITKSVDNIAPNPGDTITYTVVVTNNGPLASNDVKIFDDLPNGLTFLSSTADESSYNAINNLWGGTGNLDLNVLEVRTLIIKARVNAGTIGSSIVNTAYIQSANQPDSYKDNDTATALIAIGEADLGLTKTIDKTIVEEGDTLTYTLIVENGGPDNAPLVEVTDVLPSNMTYVSHSGGAYNTTTGIWSVGTLNDGVLDTLTLVASVNTGTAGREIYNVASAASAMNEPVAATLPHVDSVSFQVRGADLEVIKTTSATAPIAEDDTITYTIQVTNNGPDTATGISISDFLPINLTYISSTTTEGSYSAVSGIWDTLILNPNETATLTLNTYISRGGGFNNTAKVLFSDQADSYTENNTSTVFISALKNFAAGACIINMGQTPQTYDNTLKAYGLLWTLVKEELVPVDWAISPDKSFVDSLNKVDQIDFSVDGVDYYSGAFIIDELFVSDAQASIDQWLALYPSMDINCNQPAFQAPIHKTLTSFPKAVLDQQNGGLIESAFYDNIGITNELLGYYDAPINDDPIYSLYRPDGLPSNLNNCDDIYAMPHADPHTWSTLDRETFDVFIKNGGWLWAACHAPSSLETLVDIPSIPGGAPQMNYLTEEGLVLWGDHGNGTLPYYSALDEEIGQYNSTAASDPFMQFMGEVDNALQSGSEQIYIPFAAGWRPSTTIAVYDIDHPELTGDGEYPLNAAALVAYGKAYGNPDYGTLVYQASHNIASGTEAENVASARIYGNFWIQAGVDFKPEIVPTVIPEEIFSGIGSVFSVEYNPDLTYTWIAECGGTFSNPDSSWTIFTPPANVDTPVRCIMRLIVQDECGRTNFLAEPYTVFPYADIWINKTATDTVLAGDTITYNITVSNLGPSTSVGLEVRDILPAGTNVVGATPSIGTWLEPDWTIGEIDPGDTVTLTLLVATDPGLWTDTITNVAYIKSLSVDTINDNDTSSVETFIINPCDAVYFGLPDNDGDGIADACDLDNDNDGIPDAVEVCGNDTSFVCANNPGGSSPTLDDDNDGTPNYQDPDYCTLNANNVCDNLDTDGDGIIDVFDLDADNDGIPDVVEAGGVDTNGDGIADGFVDTDKDGLNDVYDADNGGSNIPSPDTDGDGILDFQDLDADNDGIPDVIEAGGTDANGDGRADDYVDADGDGFNDVVDGDPTNALALGDDSAGANTGDALVLTGTDTDGDGEPNSYPEGDTDGDGILDQLDLDADNDGIPDVIEAGGTDANGDGRADDYVDADGDGFNDAVDGDPTNALTVGTDTPGANTSDALVLTGADTDGDGVPNSYVEGDTDGDGILDHLDLDADNDGIPDVVEAGGTDVNGDGIADNYVDADGDGFNDTVDGDPTNALTIGTDTPGANTADALVLTGADTDGDGAPNSYVDGDTDGDGIMDQLDLDADNDGIPDVVEAGGTDANGDGIADNYVDADGDGFNDVVDGDPGNLIASGSDVDGTNTSDALVLTGPDTDGDGAPNSYPNGDTDGDGVLDHLDLDADNDGIPDVIEAGGTDANGDGRADDYVDADGDGFNDVVDGDPTNALALGDDSAGANTSDALQLTGVDTDGDGVPNSYIGGDTDGDGILDHLDLDADNDGIPDVVEAGGTDVNGDGIADNYIDADGDGFNDAVDGDPTNALTIGTDTPGANTSDALVLTGADTDGDGAPNSYVDGDTDGDGIMDQLDLDADNDGIPDVVEAGGTDANGDGIADNYVDADGDGFNDVVDGDPTNVLALGLDTLGANASNALILTGVDGDGDGAPDLYPSGDTDGDGVLDHLDLDADNDGIPDVIEAGGTDANGDGRADDYVDADGDGFNDVVDGDPTNALALGDDSAGANTSDALQLTGVDTDGDGEPNSYIGGDTDGDGILDHLDLDADNDGIPDVIEAGGTDANGDGRADNYVDADGDGFNDAVDGDPTNALTIGTDTPGANTADALVLTGADTDGDGAPNSYVEGDTDGDGILDHLDLDADNDGIPDVVEAGGTDVNGDGIADNYVDADRDGFNDSVDGDPTNALSIGTDTPGANTADALVLTGADTDGDGAPNSYVDGDTDGDGIMDQLDLDADNDGIPDVVEAGGTDANGDGRADNYVDADGDGFNDVVDGDPTNALALGDDSAGANTSDALILTGADGDGDGAPDSYPNGDTDGDGVLDHLDLDADNDGIPDVIEAGGTDANGDGRADDYVDADGDGFNDVVDGDPTNALALGDDSAGANTSDALQLTGVDTDGDGEPNSYIGGDTDGDGILDHLDLDADNDGIPDVVEAGGTDVNGDGIADNYVDADGDGFNDAVDGDPTNALTIGTDTPGANTSDALVLTGADTDGDGAPNSYVEGDTDGDGIMDQLDLDADNDGIPDVVEAGGTDENGDGRADDYVDADNDGFNDVVDGDPTNALALGDDSNGANTNDALILTGADGDGDGAPDSYPSGDTDGDGVLDHLDLDADNDGIPDVIEAGGTDANGDGRADDYVDADGDGFNDVVDGDPTNSLAVGSDIDGANTANALVLTGADPNLDGTPNNYPGNDTDGDGILDHLDLDADNDGIPDVVEAGGVDTDGDGIADNYLDADGDGFNDRVDGDPTNALAVGIDTAAANTANAQILTGADTDGDGAPNSYVSGDFDADGILNYLDLDADGDGISDIIEVGGTDANGDGQVDNIADTDNDGFRDAVDGDVGNDGTAENSANAQILTGVDDDLDGAPDSYPNENTDTKGYPDFLDIDADDDGIVDNVEAQSTAGFILPSGVDSDGDGIDDAYETAGTIGIFGGVGIDVNAGTTGADLNDIDNDGIPDYKDLDTDGDNIPDVQEAWDSQFDGDSEPDNGPCPDVDIDEDGLLDCYDTDTASTSVTAYLTPISDNGFNGGSTTASAPTSGDTPDDIFPDNSGVDGEADWRDLVDVCVDNKVFYAITESDSSVFTNYEYVDTSGQHVDSAFLTSVIRATTYCEPDADGWYYYYNPLEPEHHLFAIRDAAGSPNTVPMYNLVNYVEIRVDQTPGNRYSFDGVNATYVMERDWNMVFKGEPDAGSTFDVKFYFKPDELMRLDSAFDYLEAFDASLVRTPLEWFKANQGNDVSFNYQDIEFTGIDSSILITDSATNVFNENTGVASGGAELSTDGADTTTGNGRNYVQFNGLTSFSGGTAMIRGTGGGGVGLPVELIRLEANAVNNERIDVEWTTATEINNEGFEIHRSTDGVDFENIGWVEGFGSTTNIINYSFSDYEVDHDIVYYYKLKQIDYDGQYEFSDIVYAKLIGENNQSSSVTLLPNPTQGKGVIEIEARIGVKIEIQLFDIYGELIQNNELVSSSRTSRINVDLTNYSAGVYNVVVHVGESTTTNAKWVKF